MQGIILIGGEGTRLRPLTYTRPKAMVPILGRPFLEHMLVYLRRYGVTEISLALGHQPRSIQQHFGDGSRWGVRLQMVVELEPLGSGGAIKQFESQLQQPFFAFNGDVLTDFDLGAMRELHERSAAVLSIALMEVEDPSGFGVAALNENGRITAFVEKPPRAEAPSRWANAGIWLFEPRALARVAAGRRSMVELELFPELIATDERVQGYRGQGLWVDIGTPERYLAVQLRLLEQPQLQILPLVCWPGMPYFSADDDPQTAVAPTIASDAAIEGPVLLGAGAVVQSGATVQGPAVIGAGTRLGSGCRVERSVLWENCALAKGAEVRNSVLANGVRVGDNARLDQVIAGRGASVAAGRILADQRVDPGTAPNQAN